MKSPLLPHRFLLVSAAIAATGLAVSARADTYKLVDLGSSSSPMEFSNPANWTVNDVPATTCPGTGDLLLFGTASRQHLGHLALDGDYTIAGITQSFNIPCLYKSAAATSDTVSLTFTDKVGGSGYQYYYANSDTKMIFAASSTLRCATGDALESRAYATGTGEIDVFGAVSSRHITWYVSDNATLNMSPTSYTQDNNTGAINDHFRVSGGNVLFPNGFTVAGGNSSHANTFQQTGGTVTFGGDFTSPNSPWTYTFSAGTLAITEIATFGGNIAFVIPAAAAVTLDIASGKTFSATGLSADPTSSITVTGGGTFSIAPTTASIVLQNGSLGLATAGTYDLSNVSLGSGAATITLTALGARVDSLPAALANATFAANLSSVPAGTVVFQSADPAVLAKVKTDLAASVPQGFELAVSGETLSLEELSDYIFNSTATRNLLDPAGWNTASVPPDGAEVAIAGAGVVAEYASGTIPAWASVEVKDGAILRMNADADLPPVALNKSASLDISVGTTFLTNGLSAIATASLVPDLIVASGATLKVPGGMNFKNVDITLEGTLSRTSGGTLTFGYADSGEVTYIGFHAAAAIIPDVIQWDYDKCRIGVCCPASGGTVIPIDTIEFKDMPNSGTHLPMQGDSYWNGLSIGVNNPTNIAVDVVFDNTSWTINGKLLVAGGGTFRLENGSFLGNTEHETLWNRAANITEMGQVVVGRGSTLRINALGNWGGGTSTISSGYKGHEAVVVEDGGTYETYRTSGNNNAVLFASNGVYRIYRPSIYHDNNGSIYNSQNVPFNGLSSVSLAEGGVLTFTTRNGGQFGDDSGPRVVALANVPFVGGGSLSLSNATANAFGVVVRSGANTATGTAGVTAPVDGAGDTTLYFADGANWAGMVKASGDVKLVKSFAAVTDATADAPAAVSFGGVELVDDTFKLRLWQNGTCDTIALGEGGWTGTGKLDFEFVGGFTPTGAEAWKIGSQPAGATLPAALKSYYLLYTQPSATEGVVDIYLKTPKGTAILLR